MGSLKFCDTKPLPICVLDSPCNLDNLTEPPTESPGASVNWDVGAIVNEGPDGHAPIVIQPISSPAAAALNDDHDSDTGAAAGDTEQAMDKLQMKAVAVITPIKDWILKEAKDNQLHSDKTSQGVGTPVKQLKCPCCDDTFHSQKAANLHIKDKHLDYKFPCLYCDKTFQTYNVCYKHIKSYGPKKYICDECDKGFQFPMGLEEHSSIPSRHDMYTCSHCTHTFTT